MDFIHIPDGSRIFAFENILFDLLCRALRWRSITDRVSDCGVTAECCFVKLHGRFVGNMEHIPGEYHTDLSAFFLIASSRVD